MLRTFIMTLPEEAEVIYCFQHWWFDVWRVQLKV